MTDITPPGARTLTEPERQAFHRLGLTPGHWAALVAAPFYSRSNVRAPNLRDTNDRFALDRLRIELRVMAGYGDEALRYWKRLWSGDRELAPLGTRLLAWYLATDLPFAKSEHFLNSVTTAAGRFVPPAMYTGVLPFVVRDLRRLIDAYLPLSSFNLDRDPVWQAVPVPDAETMNRIARSISAGVNDWPQTYISDVPARMPAIVRVFGELVHEWWAKPDAARRAAERGLAALPSHEREAIYEELRTEWYCELKVASGWLDSGHLAAVFVTRIREWVDAVRKSAREQVSTAPLIPETSVPVVYPTYATDVAALILVSPPEPAAQDTIVTKAEPVKPPPTAREPTSAPKPAVPKAESKPQPERVTASV